MKKTLCVLLYCLSLTVFCQVGINTTSPIPQAALQIDGNTTGILINRVTLTGKSDDTTITGLTSLEEGLLVYNTANTSSPTNTVAERANAVTPGFYNWSGVEWKRLVDEDSVARHSGWGVYNDTTHDNPNADPIFDSNGTQINTPFLIGGSDPENPVKYSLPNNAGSKIESQLPTDVSTFYDSSIGAITGRNGDGVNIVVEFRLQPITNANNPRITVSIDIGGAVGEIFPRDFVLSKGQNVEHFYLSSFNAYTLGTWEANGGKVVISATSDVIVYDIRYVITRTHKAR